MKVTSKFLHFVLTFVGLMLLSFTAYLAYQEKVTSAITLLGACMCLLLPYLEHIKHFKITLKGIEAETRQVIMEAHATIEQLRAVSTGIAESTTLLVAASFSGFKLPITMRKNMVDELAKILKNIGVEENYRLATFQMWRRAVSMKYAWKIEHCFDRGRRPPDMLPQEKEDIVASLRRLYDVDRWKSKPPEDFESVLVDKHRLTPLAQMWIEDYKHFLDTGEIRHLEEWEKD